MTLLKLVACLFTSKHVYYSINNRQSNQKQAKKAKHLVQYFCLVLYCVFFCMAVLFLLLFTYIKYLTSLFLTLSSISSTISLTLSGVVVPFRNFKRTFVRCFFYVQNIWKFFVCKKRVIHVWILLFFIVQTTRIPAFIYYPDTNYSDIEVYI